MSTSMTLLELRTAVRQRADMVNSSGVYTNSFIKDDELNSYINQSYFGLYDLLVTADENYYIAPPLSITCPGSTQLISLPDGVLYSAAPAFYKLMGVDLALNTTQNAYVTLKRFEFINRNSYVYPQITSSLLGVFNPSYNIVGNSIMLIPTPSAGQILRLWYIPRLVTLSADGDLADGISGWTEYIITDAAVKCLAKEETDASVLIGQRQDMVKRINDSATNRDMGQPATISDTRTSNDVYGGPGSGGNFGGY